MSGSASGSENASVSENASGSENASMPDITSVSENVSLLPHAHFGSPLERLLEQKHFGSPSADLSLFLDNDVLDNDISMDSKISKKMESVHAMKILLIRQMTCLLRKLIKTSF